ncbi:MAG: diaminopropionate ammonia-lyase [Acholeplasmataceae bacterium]|nr:diaminopropionate ammonia-lyase [Acholeplasmataceae bacterium]
MQALLLELIKNNTTQELRPLLQNFSKEKIARVRSFHRSMWGYYQSTPLVELKELAAWLGVRNIFVKDESGRFGLKAFKGLGASYAMACCIARELGKEVDEIDFDYLTAEDVREKLGKITFATATDGNHGRGVAWMARILGYDSVVYMPKGTAEARRLAIAREGAAVRITDFNYDETVRLLAADSEKNGWTVLQDTAWPGYEEIPLWIMQGYTTMAGEALEEMPDTPTHVFAQAGVGSMAAAVQATVIAQGYEKEPVFTIMEASEANCFFRSFEQGRMLPVGGDLETIMAGLACGEINPLAWEILANHAQYCLSCRDEVAALGMRLWGNPLGKDQKITAGESGAIGGGVIGLLDKYHNLKTELGLNKESVLLFFNTEGDTFPDKYRDIVWGGSISVDFRRKNV